MLKGIIKFTQAQYEEFMKNKTITVNGITYNYDPDVLYTVEKVNVTIDTKQTISGDKDFTGKLTLNSNDVAIKKEVVTLTNSQEISGDKYFNCNIQKYGVDIATVNDIPPVVDALNSESATSSLSAKQGKVLDEKISNAIATLNGKNNSFTFDDLETLLSNFGLEKGSEVADSYLIDTNKINYNGQEYTLKNGDVFFIVDTSVPDYWYSLDDKTLYKLETTRVDLAEYAKTSDLTDYAKTSDLSDYAKTSALSDYAKLSALSDYAKLSDISTTYLKQTDIADWAKAANPPSNVVLIDDVDQNVDGLKVFLQGIETGNGILSTESGYKDSRKCADDSNNINQLSLFVDSKGAVKLTHKNRTLNAATPDSYLSFNATKLRYGTSGVSGTQASSEYDIITSDYDAYKFALQEFNKSINLIDKNKYAIIEGSLGIDVDHLIIGETYTFTSNKPIYWFKISDAAAGYNSVSKDPSGSGFNRFTFTMSKNSNINPGKRQYLFVSIDLNNVWTCPASISELNGYEFQIEKGTKTHDINSYNGEIVWTGDKEYKLWKDEYDKCTNAMNPQSTSFTLSGAQVTYSKGDNYFTINGTTGTANISSTLMYFTGLSEATPYSVKLEYISGSITPADSNYKDNIRVLICNSDYSSSFGINNNTTFDHGYVVPGSNGVIYVRLMTNLHKGGDVFNNYKFRIILTKDWREKNDMPKPYRYLGEILHEKNVAEVAITGHYSSLSGLPTIPTDYISYGSSQSLTSSQKIQAAKNMGIDKPWNLWWTNTNSSSLSGKAAFPSTNITLGWSMTSGQAYEIKVVYLVEPADDDYGYASYQEQTFVFWGGTAQCRGKFNGISQKGLESSAIRIYQRELRKTAANALSFSTCKKYGYSASHAFGDNDWACVPVYIYGREIDMNFA